MKTFRYREKDTIIHRLNPLPRIAWVISISALAMIFDHPIYLALLFLSTLPPVAAGGVRREWASFLKPALYLCLAIIIINALVSYHGAHVLWQAPSNPVDGRPHHQAGGHL
jgi:energy-coupling factor transport system permease protein